MQNTLHALRDHFSGGLETKFFCVIELRYEGICCQNNELSYCWDHLFARIKLLGKQYCTDFGDFLIDRLIAMKDNTKMQ